SVHAVDSLGHFRRCSPLWEGRPPCRPTNHLASLQGEKWDGVEAVPPSIERVLPKRSLCLVRPIPNAALARSDLPRTSLFLNYLVAEFGVSSVERYAAFGSMQASCRLV